MNKPGWIGCDLDGTLALYDGWKGAEHIGEPIPLMLERVKNWLAEGVTVKIVTARVSGPDMAVAFDAIEKWCNQHIGQVLPITNKKDFGMIVLYDDRCVQVERNTGVLIGKEEL